MRMGSGINLCIKEVYEGYYVIHRYHEILLVFPVRLGPILYIRHIRMVYTASSSSTPSLAKINSTKSAK